MDCEAKEGLRSPSLGNVLKNKVPLFKKQMFTHMMALLLDPYFRPY